MSKKSFIQIFLIIFLIIFSYLIFDKYFDQQKVKINLNINDLKNSNEIKNSEDKQDLIKNVKYKSNNAIGDIYELTADFGESDLEKPNLMFLTNVRGVIIFKNEKKSNIILTSKFANFNTVSFETTFMDNVKITRKDEIITGNELYLILEQDEESLVNNDLAPKEKNLIRMSENIFFKKPGYTGRADILEIDLTSKNTKIFMNDDKNKVTITSLIK